MSNSEIGCVNKAEGCEQARQSRAAPKYLDKVLVSDIDKQNEMSAIVVINSF